MSKPGITGELEVGGDGARESWDGEVGETKAEADREGTREGLERVSATKFPGPRREPRNW